MDVSGTLQGAGGVGGLLAVSDSTGSYFPTFDGNGNVGEYLDSTGTSVAHYEYDPFGNTTITFSQRICRDSFKYKAFRDPFSQTSPRFFFHAGYKLGSDFLVEKHL